MGIFFRSKEEQAKAKLKRMREGHKQRSKAESLKRRTEKFKVETTYYKAKAEKKEAKRAAGFQWPAEKKVRKKAKGKKLSRKIGMRLI